MAIFMRKPALSELITLNCCCLSVLCLLLVLLVEATDEESESDDESDPSSESDEEVEDDDDDSGDLPGGFDSTGGVLLTVVMAAKVGDFASGIFDHFCLTCLLLCSALHLPREASPRPTTGDHQFSKSTLFTNSATPPSDCHQR